VTCVSSRCGGRCMCISPRDGGSRLHVSPRAGRSSMSEVRACGCVEERSCVGVY
jgi:hypothetical protein